MSNNGVIKKGDVVKFSQEAIKTLKMVADKHFHIVKSIETKGITEIIEFENGDGADAHWLIIVAKQSGLSVSNINNTTLPEGFKVYECTNCQEVNVLRDNGEIGVGFCSKCEHPIWNN